MAFTGLLQNPSEAIWAGSDIRTWCLVGNCVYFLKCPSAKLDIATGSRLTLLGLVCASLDQGDHSSRIHLNNGRFLGYTSKSKCTMRHWGYGPDASGEMAWDFLPLVVGATSIIWQRWYAPLEVCGWDIISAKARCSLHSFFLSAVDNRRSGRSRGRVLSPTFSSPRRANFLIIIRIIIIIIIIIIRNDNNSSSTQ